LWTLSVAWRLSVIGAGKGLFMGPNQTAILAAVPPEATATVGGVSGVRAGLVAALAFTTIASACCLAIPSRTSVQIARDSGAAGNLRAAGP